MKKAINLICLSIVVLLAGCGRNEAAMNAPSTPTLPQVMTPSPPAATPSPSPAPSATPLPTHTLLPSETVAPALPAASTVIPEARLQFQCLEVEPKLPDAAAVTGVIVLEEYTTISNTRRYFDTFLFDMTGGQTTQITTSKETPGDFHAANINVSPDRKFLAYQSLLIDRVGGILENDLVIATAGGLTVKTIPWDEENGWGNILGWSSNDLLVIDLSKLDPAENQGLKPATLLAFNPFSGNRQILKPDFPGIYTQPVPYWNGWSGRRYNPALTHAFYLQDGKGGDSAMVLWDLQKQLPLASLTPPRNVSMPVWSPDGSRLATSFSLEGKPAEELFLVSQDGKTEQLTNFNAYYTKDEGFLAYDWSPDGRYIAAWITTETSKKELVIVDTETRQTTNYCVRIDTRSPLKLIWSPDGSQLLVYDKYEEDHSRTILVDRVLGFAAQIAENMEPLGWLLAP